MINSYKRRFHRNLCFDTDFKKILLQHVAAQLSLKTLFFIFLVGKFKNLKESVPFSKALCSEPPRALQEHL